MKWIGSNLDHRRGPVLVTQTRKDIGMGLNKQQGSLGEIMEIILPAPPAEKLWMLILRKIRRLPRGENYILVELNGTRHILVKGVPIYADLSVVEVLWEEGHKVFIAIPKTKG